MLCSCSQESIETVVEHLENISEVIKQHVTAGAAKF